MYSIIKVINTDLVQSAMHNYLWILSFEHNLSEEEQKTVLEVLDRFSENWTSHDKPVQSTYNILHDRFLIITGSTEEEVTGCTHDRVTRLMKRFEKRDIHMAPRANVFYKQDGIVLDCDRATFIEQYKTGEITDDTLVYNTTLIKPQELENFEVPLKECWHKQLVK